MNIKKMFRRLLSTFILIITVSYGRSQHLSKNAKGLDVFKIDLDLAPEKRFIEVGKHFKSEVALVLEKYLPFPLPSVVSIVGKLIWQLKPENYLETQGLGEALGIDKNIILASQLFYDTWAFCTSIIAQDKNGTVIHARNLDFYYAPQMRNITYEAHFYKNDKILYSAVMLAPLTSVLTGLKSNKFSITLNERKPSNHKSILNLLSNIGRILKGYVSVGTLIRYTFESCDDFNCAFELLKNSKQISPSYYSIAGVQPNQGAIISKGTEESEHIETLGKNQWFIVQTNDDHWKGICLSRCSYVKDSLNDIGKEDFIADDLPNILKNWPSNNSDSIYTSLIIPAKDLFVNSILDGDKPVDD